MPASKRVLVVDDEADVQDLVCRVLEDTGYAVDSARDGLEALAKISLSAPDLVILDLMMPELDGWAVLRRLSERRDAPPVVVLSAFADCRTAMGAGAVAYLAKPFDIRALVGACQRALLTAA